MNTQETNQDSLKVGLDYFLYSCFEYETTCKALPRKIMGNTRWPVALEIGENCSSAETNAKSFEVLFTEVLVWYTEKFPSLLDEHIELSILPEIVPAMVMITGDISLLAKIKDIGEGILFDKNRADNGEVWKTIEKLAGKYFPYISRFVVRYLQWAFGVERAEQIDVANRPPVGRYVPLARTSSRTNGNNDSAQKKPPVNGNKAPHNEHDQHAAGSQQKKYPQKRDAHPATKGPRSQERKKEHDPELEQKSSLAVELAIKNLTDSPSLPELRLDPANSYYRRLQHQQIKDLGFDSYSTGEGTDRSVVVTRVKEG